jgi:hypothetical protein
LPEIWGGCEARGGRISLMDLRPTSNAAAAPKSGNPEGCFLAGVWRRCSSVRERCGYLPSSRLASRPPENSAPIPHFVIGSKTFPESSFPATLRFRLTNVRSCAVFISSLTSPLERGMLNSSVALGWSHTICPVHGNQRHPVRPGSVGASGATRTWHRLNFDIRSQSGIASWREEKSWRSA